MKNKEFLSEMKKYLNFTDRKNVYVVFFDDINEIGESETLLVPDKVYEEENYIIITEENFLETETEIKLKDFVDKVIDLPDKEIVFLDKNNRKYVLGNFIDLMNDINALYIKVPLRNVL